MTNPDLSTQLETALDELDMAHNSITIALSDARATTLPPFRLAQLEGALFDTQYVMRNLKELLRALKAAYPTTPL